MSLSDERIHHVTLRFARDYQFVAEFDDVIAAPPLRLDEPRPLGEERGPNAAALLGAAVGDCLAASLVFCLRKARVSVDGLTARVATHVTRNEKGRFRIGGIDVELVPDVGEVDRDRLARCEELFEEFCVVTASVRHGIDVNVSIKAPEHVGVAVAQRTAALAVEKQDDQC